MADFGNPFDSFGGAFGTGGMEFSGSGVPTDDAFEIRRKRIVKALIEGETGVQFESLALFAEPLFSLYELNPAEAFTLKTDPDKAPDEVVALMETARVLWAFFSLSPSSRAHRRQALVEQLVGGEAEEDDMLGLEGVIEAAEIHWQALLPEEIEMAQKTGHEVLSFDDLLHHAAFRIDADQDPVHAGFGDGELSETEARALFAQPLLEAPEVMLDADAFDSALERADAYWDAAQSGDTPEAIAQALSPDDGGDVEEARTMLARYAKLFPKRSE
ncbi:hypothetical protein [Rubricoccus marinus]|uniref:Uncharacterized protein n=1 Tax=Rubricoccus marinus TaxID=716817 RepID=A0A259TX94_9BACT|nr:hypothetical protein [Rubricoccus marinus]OZC02194.1 hypothetical protein BSZ36_03840 [Rubricoccus marinus]